ncbi:MAG TPA: hypothetical protein VGL72_22710, partial [Bryobacteraceae bacterium]
MAHRSWGLHLRRGSTSNSGKIAGANGTDVKSSTTSGSSAAPQLDGILIGQAGKVAAHVDETTSADLRRDSARRYW